MKNGKYELQQAPFAVVGYPPQQPEEQLSEKNIKQYQNNYL